MDGGREPRTTVPHANGTVRVRPFHTDDGSRWEDFVARTPQATFFHRLGWRTVIERALRHRTHYLVAERRSLLVGILPLAEVKSRLFGHSLSSLPFCAHAGPVAADAETEQALIDAASDLAATLGAEHLELRNVEPKTGWPAQDLYVSFRRPILPTIEANLLAIPRKQRAMVRKGLRAGLASEIDPTVDRFFALYADNVHRHGTPALAKSYFQTLAAVFGQDCEVLTVVDGHGQPLSSVLSFYFRNEVLPYYAGDTEAAREVAANDFKYWELMRRGCERGLGVFDYGRSKRGTGSFDFKRNWGFDPAPLAYEYRLLKRDSVPQHNPLNPKYRALIALWRRLPRAAANALGPLVVRNLG